MAVKILTFNAQRGQRGLELMESLFTESKDCTYFFFQRFPEKWLSVVPKGFKQYYSPSFTDADSGALTLSKESLNVESQYSADLKVEGSQSFVIQKMMTSHGLFINTLPPYPEEGVITEQDYENHLNLVFNHKADLIVGDFHLEDHEIKSSLTRGFTNFSKGKNFSNRRGLPSNLNKIYLSEKLTLTSESVLHFSTEPNTHSPSVFTLSELS